MIDESAVKDRLEELGPESKVYLKENHAYEIFTKHGIKDFTINFLFDRRKIIRINPHPSINGRLYADINDAANDRTIRVIFTFDPVVDGEVEEDTVGIVTAFVT